MKYIPTPIDGLFEIEPEVYGDQRGYFFESFRADEFKKNVADVEFVQDNQSFSTSGVLRGIHFQIGDKAQGKLVRVTKGKVLDVAVDLRKGSPTFGKWHSVVLDADKQNMFYVPEGFGHGIYIIEDAVFLYKCTNYYHKESERSIIWNDKTLDIDWTTQAPLLSEKDEKGVTFNDYIDTL